MAECSACGAQLAGGDGFPQWCRQCGWGIDASQAALPPARPAARAYRATSDRLLARFLREPARGSTSWRTNAVVAFAAVVHLIGIGLTAVALWLLASGSILGGVALLALTLWWCPWWRRLRVGRGERVDERSPLHAWVASVAAGVGVAAPTDIVIDDATLASTFRSVTGRRVLRLSPQFFALLRPDERAAVLAHELGHWRGGDLSRLAWVDLAGVALAAPLRVAGFVGDEDDVRRVLVSGALTPVHGVGMLVLRALASPFYPVYVLYASWALEPRLVGEYRAHVDAAGFAGTAAELRVLTMITCSPEQNSAIRRQVAERVATIDWSLVRAAIDSVPADEIHRRLLLLRPAELRVLRTHPPTVDVVRVLQARPVSASWMVDLPLDAVVLDSMAQTVADHGVTVANTW